MTRVEDKDIEVAVLSREGKELKKLKLSGHVFNTESASEDTIYYAIHNELANMRVGTASTKGRAEVRGSGAKPWRQKGTGRARAGHKRSPIWVGGGVVFGPKPRDYSYTLPKKVKRLAFRSILTQKIDQNLLTVVEDFNIENGKTKDMAQVLKNLSANSRTVLVLTDADTMLKRAGKNIPNLTILSYNRLRAHDLFYAKRVIVLEKAALSLGEFYGA